MDNILIVDDEPSVCRSLGKILESAGYGVETAEDFNHATDALAEHDFDVIIVDTVLPGVSGMGLLKYIAAEEIASPVIMITGEPNVETATASVRDGAYDYIAKPVRRSEFLAVVRRATEKKHLIDAKNELKRKNIEYQKELEKKVDERTRELKHAYELLEKECMVRAKFMRETSHEFINPLSIVKGYLTLLIDDDNLSDESRRKLIIIEENVKRIDGLVRDTLEMSKEDEA